MMTRLYIPLLSSLLMLVPSVAKAEFDFCFKAYLSDPDVSTDAHFRGCPKGFGYTTGLRRDCQDYTVNKVRAVGWLISFYEYDPTGGDDSLGGIVSTVGGSAYECVTLDPQESGVNEVYPQPNPIVTSTTHQGTNVVIAVDPDTDEPYVLNNYRDLWASCSDNSTCYYDDGNSSFRIKSDANAYNWNQTALNLDSAQRVLQVYSDSDPDFPGVFTENAIWMTSPVDTTTCGLTWTSPTGSFAPYFWVGDFNDPNCGNAFWATASHEMGHILQTQLYSNYGPPGQFGESFGTVEGWADYVSATSWWNPSNATGALRANGTSITNVGSCTNPSSASVKEQPGYTGRAFWDLADGINETVSFECAPFSTIGSEADTRNFPLHAISAVWAHFDNGTANRRKSEPEPDGGNLKDYESKAMETYGSTWSGAENWIDLNCLCQQSNN